MRRSNSWIELAPILIMVVAIVIYAFGGWGNSFSRTTVGGIDVVEHRMNNGVTCYTAQLSSSVSIDCK